MKTLRDLLREADPLGDEPHWAADERRVSREVVVAAPRAAVRSPLQRVAFAVIVALTLIATMVVGSHFWSRAAVDVAAAVRFEVRLAEENRASGLREAPISRSGRTIYFPQEVVVTNGDIAQAQVVQGDDASRFSVMVAFTDEGAEKMFRATQNHIGRPLAILVDGEVVVAPVVRAPISSSAVIDGNFTKAEAERIADGILGR